MQYKWHFSRNFRQNGNWAAVKKKKERIRAEISRIYKRRNVSQQDWDVNTLSYRNGMRKQEKRVKMHRAKDGRDSVDIHPQGDCQVKREGSVDRVPLDRDESTKWWMKPSEKETRTRGVGPGWECVGTSSGHWHAVQSCATEGEGERKKGARGWMETCGFSPHRRNDATYFVACFICTIKRRPIRLSYPLSGDFRPDGIFHQRFTLARLFARVTFHIPIKTWLSHVCATRVLHIKLNILIIKRPRNWLYIMKYA